MEEKKMIKATINGIEVEVAEGGSILDAARTVQIKIPTLCKHPDLDATGACGICVVRNKANGRMLRSCCTPLENGMDLLSEDAEIVEVRKTVLDLLLSRHPNECLTCARNQNCELQTLCADFGVRRETLPNIVPDLPKDDSTKCIVLDPRKCINCGRCVDVCQNMQDVWALSFLNRGIDTRMAPAGDISLAESPCVNCGQCSAHCPTGAIVEYEETDVVWEKLHDPETYCVAQIAPAVRVAIGEAFGQPIGTNMEGKMYAALRRMGFNAVFDTNFGADFTIMEESAEFVKRFTKGEGELPLITTCCPSWVDFMEKYHSDMIPHFSTCKSPHEMLGALAKTYYADKMGVDPKKIYMVSIMPCTAKKYEIRRCNDMSSSGCQDVDVSLTTREIARMFKQSSIDFVNIPDGEADSILGDYTGGGVIFGATGGVMEAALRNAVWMVTGKVPEKPEFEAVRGLEGIKECKIDLAGKEVRIAVAHGLKHVEEVLDKVRAAKTSGGELPYHFIEVMACPGGCVGGGGQPYGVTNELRSKRAAGLYKCDTECAQRTSSENAHVQKVYAEFLGEPLSEKAHHLLHTHYSTKRAYQR